MNGDQRGHHGIHQPFANLAPFAVEYGGVGHQMADIAHQHQRTALQRDLRLPIGRGVATVFGHTPSDGLAALFKCFRQVAFHQAQPVAIGQHFVLGIHRRDTVFTIHDGRKSGFDDHIRNAGGVVLADGVIGVDPDLDMQPVVAQKHRVGRLCRAPVARKLRRISQAAGRGILRHHSF